MHSEQHGLCRALSYIVQTFTAETSLCLKLSSPLKLQLPTKWNPTGTAADFMINVSTLSFVSSWVAFWRWPPVCVLYRDNIRSAKFPLSSAHYRPFKFCVPFQESHCHFFSPSNQAVHFVLWSFVSSFWRRPPKTRLFHVRIPLCSTKFDWLVISGSKFSTLSFIIICRTTPTWSTAF